MELKLGRCKVRVRGAGAGAWPYLWAYAGYGMRSRSRVVSLHFDPKPEVGLGETLYRRSWVLDLDRLIPSPLYRAAPAASARWTGRSVEVIGWRWLGRERMFLHF